MLDISLIRGGRSGVGGSGQSESAWLEPDSTELGLEDTGCVGVEWSRIGMLEPDTVWGVDRVEEKCNERVTIPEVVKDGPVEEVQLARRFAFLIDCVSCPTEGRTEGAAVWPSLGGSRDRRMYLGRWEAPDIGDGSAFWRLGDVVGPDTGTVTATATVTVDAEVDGPALGLKGRTEAIELAGIKIIVQLAKSQEE